MRAGLTIDNIVILRTRWKRRRKEVGHGIGMRRKDHGPTRWEKAAEKEKGKDHQDAGIVGIPRIFKGIALKEKEMGKEARVKDIPTEEEVKVTQPREKEKEEKEKDIPKEETGIKEREEDS